MSLYHNRYRVESTRLKGWDYTADGWYFVTICTQGRECFFGQVEDRRMRLSRVGDIALRFWEDIPNHSANAGLDAFVIMPDHLHGIVTIKAPVGSTTTDQNREPGAHNRRRGVACNVSTSIGNVFAIVPPERGSLGAIFQIRRDQMVPYERLHIFRLAAAVL